MQRHRARSAAPRAGERKTRQSGRLDVRAGAEHLPVPAQCAEPQYRVTFMDMSSASALWVSAPTEMKSTPASA